ncbi:MAG: chemotaxis protein CheC [Clostridiales bacterium]|nr:chemotaxis protein CheC [Clostridiales bacterium]
MNLKNFEDSNSIGFDVLKEIGSIGTGNAATALSTVLHRKIEMSLPDVDWVEFNQAIKELGGPEKLVAGVLVELSGDVHGIMLFLQNLEFINIILEGVLGKKIDSFDQIDSLEVSALTEVGNIIISSYVNALSSLTGITMNLSVPSVSINMLGGIMNVPIAIYGYQMDKLMTINGTFKCDEEEVYSRLLLLPDVESLDYIMGKLGVEN